MSRTTASGSRLLAWMLAAAAVAAALAGCGGSSSGVQAGGEAKAARRVNVEESEFRLTLSKTSLAPGTYTFVAKNVGKIPHALEIEGPGLAEERTPGTIGSGESASLTVDLKAGSYELYCPVGNHRQLGMETHLVVGGGAMSGTTSSGGGGYGY